MSRLLARLPIAHDADIVSVRQCARCVAEWLGFDRQTQTRIATAVSEIARNAYYHGGGGEIDFAVDAPVKPALHLGVMVKYQLLPFTSWLVGIVPRSLYAL